MDNLAREHLVLVGAQFKKLVRAIGYEPFVMFEDYNAGRSFELDSVRVIFTLRSGPERTIQTRRGLMDFSREIVEFADAATAASHILNQLLTESAFIAQEFAHPAGLRYLGKQDMYGASRF